MSMYLKVRGNLGQDCDLKTVNDTGFVLNFSIASSRYKPKTDASGKTEYEQDGHTEWIDCEYWNRNAAHLHKILKRGMPVVAMGEAWVREWQNKDGETIRTLRLRVAELYIVPAERVEAIDLRPARSVITDSATTAAEDESQADDTDIPF